MNKKLRVWWKPQVGVEESFYIPVSSPEEGKKVLNMLAAYETFQLQHNIKPDYYNAGGLEMYDEEDMEWIDWIMSDETNYFEDIDDYCSQCNDRDQIEAQKQELFKQIDWNLIHSKEE